MTNHRFFSCGHCRPGGGIAGDRRVQQQFEHRYRDPLGVTQREFGPNVGTTGSGDLSAQTADGLQAAIDKWVEQGSLTGMTAAVVTPDGVWSGAAGVDAADTPLQPDSAMSIMSISKTYTAAEVMLAGRPRTG